MKLLLVRSTVLCMTLLALYSLGSAWAEVASNGRELARAGVSAPLAQWVERTAFYSYDPPWFMVWHVLVWSSVFFFIALSLQRLSWCLPLLLISEVGLLLATFFWLREMDALAVSYRFCSCVPSTPVLDLTVHGILGVMVLDWLLTLRWRHEGILGRYRRLMTEIKTDPVAFWSGPVPRKAFALVGAFVTIGITVPIWIEWVRLRNAFVALQELGLILALGLLAWPVWLLLGQWQSPLRLWQKCWLVAVLLYVLIAMPA
jgi:hypothetical protein